MADRSFNLGVISIHEDARKALERNRQSAAYFLCRHGRGEWGKAMTGHDIELSEHGLETGGPVQSAHYLKDDSLLIIHTNGTRTETVVYIG